MVEQLLIAGSAIAATASPTAGSTFPGALPGETVEVEAVAGHPDRRRLLNVERPSAERIAPICPHFGVCGGCAVQHWEIVRVPRVETRSRGRGFAAGRTGLSSRRTESTRGEGRRRAVHARSGTQSVLEVGFSAARSHHLVAIDRCPVLSPKLGGALKAAWAIAETLATANKPLDIHVTATDDGLDVDVRGSVP